MQVILFGQSTMFPLLEVFISVLCDTFVLNKYNLWKIFQPHLNPSHIDFQHSVALNFFENPLAIGQKYTPQLKVNGRDPMVVVSTQNFIHLEKKTYVNVYKAENFFWTWPRLVFAPADSNRFFMIKRFAQTALGCSDLTKSA